MAPSPKRPIPAIAAAVLAVLCLSGCLVLQNPIMSRPDEGGVRTVEMQAGNYSFDPNNIEALEGDQLRFLITNVDDREHTIVFIDPSGEEIESRDLPPQTTVRATVTLMKPGKYTFSCTQFLHALLGMKGQITAVPR